MIAAATRFIADETGATAVEYGLVAALIALALLVGFGHASSAIGMLFGDNNGAIQEAFSRN